MKGVQCYELSGGIALKNHTCSFSLRSQNEILNAIGFCTSVLKKIRFFNMFHL